MRSLLLVAAVMSVTACNRGAANNNTANAAVPAPAANVAAPAAIPAPPAAPAATAAAALPEGFPSSDQSARGAECVVYLGLADQAGARPGGHDSPILEQAAGQWRAGLMIIGGHSEEEVTQLVGSSVNPLMSTPAAQRDAAAAWCVQNAPEPDPDAVAK